nr:glutamate-cysteine ligase [uncultured Gammaproteobacteria bacterium]
MYQTLNKRLNKIEEQGFTGLLKNSLTGLEKESLRVNSKGNISQTDHPEVLGSALKNQWITTDYAEAMLELITPPCDRAFKSLDFLLDVETFVYQHIDNELLWTSSMPCVIRGEEDITIAKYGTSNAGKMKSVYRQGLAERYGKVMQVISGIHFNYSVATEFWPAFQEVEGDTGSQQDFINNRYMGMTRNIQRYGWIIPYLFGTSPAVCKSFLSGMSQPKTMKAFKEFTYYEPYGTSLRMGDIGYTNHKEDERGIKASYNSLDEYIASLRCAINTPHKEYVDIGLKAGDEYLQLNTNILQIENEYYSSVRPKQILEGFEKPTDALERRGIQYVELRSVDINAFRPAGMTHQQLYFLEIFMMFCLLQDSPEITESEATEIDDNQSLVAHQGRKPNLQLSRNGKDISLQHWASDLFDEMSGVADILDKAHNETCYAKALSGQKELIEDPSKTPSAMALDDIMNRDGSYYAFAKRKSEEHRDYFLQRELEEKTQQRIELVAEKSLQQQRNTEKENDMDFDTFLQKYFDNQL